MSYEKVKRITIKGDKITINSACNNVRPLIFSTWEYGQQYESLRDKLFWLFKDVLDGNLHLETSVNPRIKNSLMVYYANPLTENRSCYKEAERYRLTKANEIFKLKREDFENDFEFERAISKKLYEDDELREKLYIEAQHYAYDNVINSMIEAYLNDSVEKNKYIVVLEGRGFLTKLNYSTYRYTWDRTRAKQYDMYDAWHNSQYLQNSRIERA